MYCLWKRHHGFTLIEMLVVIAIIGILASLLMPSLSEAFNTAKYISCTNNTRQIGMASSMYENDFHGCLVLTSYWQIGTEDNHGAAIGNWSQYLPKVYEPFADLKDSGSLLCPSWEGTTVNYGINNGFSTKTDGYFMMRKGLTSPWPTTSIFVSPSKTFRFACTSTIAIGRWVQLYTPQHRDNIEGPATFLDGHTEKMDIFNIMWGTLR